MSLYEEIMQEAAAIRAASNMEDLQQAYWCAAMHLESYTLDADNPDCPPDVFEHLYSALIAAYNEVKAQIGGLK